MPEERETDLKTIDVNSADLPDGPVTEIDKEADAFEMPPPPPAGIYKLKLFLGDRKHQLGYLDKAKKEDVYYMSFLEAVVVEPKEYEGKRLLPNVTTTVFRGATTSQTATLCNKILIALGSDTRVEGERSAKWVMKALDKLLMREPVVVGDCDWEAFSAEEEGRVDRRTGKAKKGRTIVRGMRNFPQAEDGTRLNFVADKFGNRCFARLVVNQWLDKYEPKAVKAKAGSPIKDLGEEIGEEAPAPEAIKDDFASLAGLNEDFSL